MSSRQSFLSSPKYGYDIAVGVTQASINATMKQYLDGLPIPEFVICFVEDKEGKPALIDYDQLKKKANGADPFSIPHEADPATHKEIIKLNEAGFITAFKAQIGLPPGLSPDKIPNIVTLESDTSIITFTLMCAKFTAVELVLGRRQNKWINVSQNPQSPLRFTSKIDLRQIQADNDKLPPAVKKQKEAFIERGYGFTIQQLFLDLDTAFGATTPDIVGIDPGSWLRSVLDRYFMSCYMNTLKKKPAPALGYSFSFDQKEETLASTFPITHTAMAVSPFVDGACDKVPKPSPIQQEVSTLNYQCTTNHKKPQQTVPFNWNWVEENEIGDFDGVMAINRNTLANYLHDQLIELVKRNCYDAWVRVWLEGVGCYYAWKLNPMQTPVIKFTQTGPNVLNFSYDSEGYDKAGSVVTVGKMCLRPNYNVTVTFSNNAITIKQRLVIWLEIGCIGQTADGNVIDRTITDTYNLTIESNRLLAKQTTTTEDHSTMGSVGKFFNFFTGVDDLVNNVGNWLQNFTQSELTSMPLSVVQDFIFPGGNAFAFKKVMFSDNQDLLSHITYLAPETASYLNVPHNR